jgi:integrase
VFTTKTGGPLRRSGFGNAWRKATVDAGVPGFVFHGLRHYHASLLIRHGESIKTVQERLGHASAVETLDTYSHLWPDSDDRTREAVDSVLTPAPAADSPRTGGGQI